MISELLVIAAWMMGLSLLSLGLMISPFFNEDLDDLKDAVVDGEFKEGKIDVWVDHPVDNSPIVDQESSHFNEMSPDCNGEDGSASDFEVDVCSSFDEQTDEVEFVFLDSNKERSQSCSDEVFRISADVEELKDFLFVVSDDGIEEELMFVEGFVLGCKGRFRL